MHNELFDIVTTNGRYVLKFRTSPREAIIPGTAVAVQRQPHNKPFVTTVRGQQLLFWHYPCTGTERLDCELTATEVRDTLTLFGLAFEVDTLFED